MVLLDMLHKWEDKRNKTAFVSFLLIISVQDFSDSMIEFKTAIILPNIDKT